MVGARSSRNIYPDLQRPSGPIVDVGEPKTTCPSGHTLTQKAWQGEIPIADECVAYKDLLTRRLALARASCVRGAKKREGGRAL
jgi:hypothetical protein